MPKLRPPKPEGILSVARTRAKSKQSPSPNPWDRPPIPTTGDETADELYRAVGYALTGWEFLEIELAGLFDILIGKNLDSHASHRAYGSVTIWNVRSDMLRATADAYFLAFHNPPLQKCISDAINRVNYFASRRNDIAHGIVTSYDEFMRVTNPLGGFNGWLLFPAYTSTKAMKEPFRFPKYAFSAEMINDFGAKFRSIRSTISELIEEVHKRETLPEEHPE
jgi:hypothetical protein